MFRKAESRSFAALRTTTGVALSAAKGLLLLSSLIGAPGMLGAQKLYITNQGGASNTIVDQQKLVVDTVIDLTKLGFTPNAKPHHAIVEPDGSFWYATLIGDGRVLKFDRTNKLVGQVKMETPGLLAIDPVHDSLYVGRSMTAVNPPKSLGVIKRTSFTMVEEQEIQIPRPHALVTSRDGQWVHTASLAENRIASLEIATGRVTLTTLPGNTMRSLVQFAVTPDGSRLIVGGELSNTVLVFDLTKPPPFTPMAEFAVNGKPWDPVISADGKRAYFSLFADSAVADVDLATGKIVRTFTGGLAQPYDVILRKDGRYLFVVNQNIGAVKPGASAHDNMPGMTGMAPAAPKTGWLSIINIATGKVEKTLPLGVGPTGHGRAGRAMNRGWLLIALIGLTAEAGPSLRSGRHAQPAVIPAWNFTSRVTGIPVTDIDGRPMSAPFLGGLDVPRPQLVDVNGDGKLDLFVQERSGSLMFFEREGAEWVWRSDKFQALDVGEWFRFVDMDNDGKPDLFGEMQTGYIRVWHNDGTKMAPHFATLGDTIRDVDGRPIVADRQNILTAVDINCNGKLDLFIGRVQGVVDHYEQEGQSPDGSPRFRMLEETWQGIEVLGPEATGGDDHDRHDIPGKDSRARQPGQRLGFNGANTLAFADVDGRGVLDLYWGDFFEQGLLRFENTGTCAQPNLTGHPSRFPFAKPLLSSGYNAPAFGDVDGDGNVDLVNGVIGGAYGPTRTSIENLYYVQQSPKGTWTQKTKRLVTMIDVGSDAAPTLADINGDGLLDLIIGGKIAPHDPNTGTLSWLENVGTATQPAFRERGLLPVKGQFSYAPTFVDLDGDGTLDLVVGTWSDRIQWYRNTGTPKVPVWTMADSALVTITRGSNTAPSFGDLDGDGLVDLVIGKAAGTIILYKNIGTKTLPKFQLVSDNFQSIKVGRRSAPVLADMDGDGRLDLLIGADDGSIELWHNVGTSTIRFEKDASFVLKVFPGAMPAVGDVRHTGRPDIFVGTAAGGVRWLENH